MKIMLALYYLCKLPINLMTLFQSFSDIICSLMSKSTFYLEPYPLHLIQVISGRSSSLANKPQISSTFSTCLAINRYSVHFEFTYRLPESRGRPSSIYFTATSIHPTYLYSFASTIYPSINVSVCCGTLTMYSNARSIIHN